ncbi:MAG: AtpZ/AtpI family protein [Bacteroidales bacterium]|nr:AtpZ/AtpI family protein [Bacteroidales bacterium]
MIAIILVSVWAGTKLDEKFHKDPPLFLIFFVIFGVFFALYVALKDFVKFK